MRTLSSRGRTETTRRRSVIPDRLQLLLNKTIPSKISNTETITASGRFAEGLPTTLRDHWGHAVEQHVTTRSDTDQLNLVWSHTISAAGIRTNPPEPSVPINTESEHTHASIVSSAYTPPLAQHLIVTTSWDPGRRDTIAKSEFPVTSTPTGAKQTPTRTATPSSR